VKGWTPDQRKEVEQYCGAVHLSASDNEDVVVPERPEFLDEALIAALKEADNKTAIELPTVAQLAEVLAGITDAEVIRTMQQSDERKSAQPIYEARLVEIAAAPKE
jgi:hypothetical protein